MDTFSSYDGTGEVPQEKLSKLAVPAGKTVPIPIKLKGSLPCVL